MANTPMFEKLYKCLHTHTHSGLSLYVFASVCVSERERERVCVCVCVCMRTRTLKKCIFQKIFFTVTGWLCTSVRPRWFQLLHRNVCIKQYSDASFSDVPSSTIFGLWDVWFCCLLEINILFQNRSKKVTLTLLIARSR
jgi:hypothetical protein